MPDEIEDKAKELLDQKKAEEQTTPLIQAAKEEREKLEKARDEVRIEIQKLEKLKADTIIAGRGQAGYQPAPPTPKEIADGKALEIGKRLRNWK